MLTVIASEAKQAIPVQMDCLAAALPAMAAIREHFDIDTR
jgi:hypothetical protein